MVGTEVMTAQEERWLRPGETLWVGEVDGSNWCLTYDGDNGKAWSLELREDRAGGRNGSLTYDYEGKVLADRDSPPAASMKVFRVLNTEVLTRAFGVIVSPGSLHQKVLDTLSTCLAQNEWTDGKLLRKALQPASKLDVMAAVGQLAPRYVEQLFIEGEAVDSFRVTLAGALHSN
jgi:hypothetical protein